MLVREVLENVRSYNGGWDDPQLINAINFVYQLMLGFNSSYTRAYDPVTGKNPEITPDQVEFTISDAREITEVYDGKLKRDDLLIHGDTIIFNDDDVDETFEVVYYKAPVQVTGANVEIDMPRNLYAYFEAGIMHRLNWQTQGDAKSFIEWQSSRLGGLREFKRKLGHIRDKGRITDDKQQLYSAHPQTGRTCYC